MSGLLDLALQAAANGLTVVPPRQDGTKAPDGRWREYETTPPTVEQLHAWYETGERTGIGIVTGATSGNLEMLELEGRAVGLWRDFCQACEHAGIGDVLDQVVDGYAETTPSGGVHLIYRCETPVAGNQKLARRPSANGVDVLIETRGEGGYVVVAPSNGGVHPTGGRWEILRGGFDTITTLTAEQRQQLLEVARSFDEMPALEPLRPHTPAVAPVGESWMDHVVADFNQATTWGQILSAAGWQHHHRHGQIDYWTRPGKDPHDGHSATTNATGTDRLIVFSSSVAGFDTADGNGPSPSYDRFGAWTVIQHGGDRAAAAHRANEHGFGPQRTPRATEGDLHELIATSPLDPQSGGQADDDIVPGRSWTRTPLGDLVHGLQTGTLATPTPTLGRFHSGVGALWYPGRVNGLYGEPGKGKTWIALCVAAEQLTAGHTVAWIDLEEPAQGIVTRLLDLGVPGPTIVNQFAHYAPEETIGLARAMADDLATMRPTFVVIDSTGEALALEGAKPNNDDEVANWFRTWPRWIATTTGAGVTVIDHVIKDESTRGLWPGGSQRKKAAINGAAFMAAPIHELGRGVEGRLKLTTSKDRQGHHRMGTRAAEFILDATGSRLTWRLEAPTRPADPSAPFRPTGLMEKVSRALEDAPEGLTKRRLADAVKGKAEYRRIALDTLHAEGFVAIQLLDREHHCTSIRPYRETDEVLPTEAGEMP